MNGKALQQSTLQLMGDRACIRQQPLVGFPEKALVLIAILILEMDSRSTRAAVATKLFENSGQTQANDNLRQLFKRVRSYQSDHGIEFIKMDKHFVWLSNKFPSCDLITFLECTRIDSYQQLDWVLEMFQGNLLTGIHSVGEELDFWFLEKRNSLSEHLAKLLVTGIKFIDFATPMALLRKFEWNCPLDDLVFATLISRLSAVGRTIDASHLYVAFKRRLMSDLEVTASPNVDEAYTAISRSKGVTTSAKEPHKTEPHNHDVIVVPRIALIESNDFSLSEQVPRRAQRYVSGLLDEIVTTLSHSHTFEVIAPFSARQFQIEDPIDTAKKYHVGYLIQTRLSGSGDNELRLSTSLIQTATRLVLWSENVPFSLDENHDRRIGFVQLLTAIITENIERAELVKFRISGDPNSFHHCLLGQYHLRSVDLANVRRARKWFRSAIQIDGHYSHAHSWLAHTLILEWVMMTRSDKSLLEQARYSAMKSVELDPLNGNGHRQLGRASLFLGQLDNSLELLNKATSIMPNNADLLADFADTLMHNSNTAEAKLHITQALKLNPLAPDVYRWIAGGVDFFSHQYDDALNHLSQMGNTDQAVRLMAACAAMQGDKEQAQRFRNKAMEIDPSFDLRTWLTRLPLRNDSHLTFYADALRAAGFI